MKNSNHLVNERSPYLLQHAHNPVDWYPWGEEAFERARTEGKPIFLSIGYSTCHWCHVMERESFEDGDVAKALNRDFVAVKVDREVRPDVDAVYMNVCQALTGGGGWPLTVFLTPEAKPFYAGTYFPKQRRYGQPGLLELLDTVANAWKSDRQRLLKSGEEITAALSGDEAGDAYTLDKAPVIQACQRFEQRFDGRWGGFGSAPKFPAPHNLLFLLHCHLLGVGEQSLEMAEKTLRAMYQGGIYDHIGGGFSRYSTDERWLVPHFEKMLYDNALLVLTYTEAYQLTGDELYRGIVEKTLEYVQREMTSPEGGFYSAQDADSDGEEGKYYVFTQSEIIRVLGEADGRTLCERYNITSKGNFEGKSILNIIGKEAALPEPATEALLAKLYDYRPGRCRLHKDDKILTAWNALMLAAYAKASAVFDNIEYLHSAEKAFNFIEDNLTDENGGLLISYRDGKAGGRGLLDDYAFLAWACLELYDSTFHAAYLERAGMLMKTVLSRFQSASGGFYLSPEDGESLILRPKEQYDGAMPSGNSVAAWCLVRLAALTGEEFWREAAERQLTFYGSFFSRQPDAVTFALSALMQSMYPVQELICVLADESDKAVLARMLGRKTHPQTAVLVKTLRDQDILSRAAPFADSYPVPEQGAIYYLCQNRSCEAPTADLKHIFDRLK